MKVFKTDFRIWTLPLFLLSGSCSTDPGDDENPSNGSKASFGTFQVTLIPPTEFSQGYTSVLGKLFTGPSPSTLIWEEQAKSGSCKVYKPRAPFCETPCGSGATCVDDNKCQDFPKAIGVGKVTVDGLKTRAGATSFVMDPVLNSYQPTGGVIVAFPPFAEGDAVTFSASGDTSVAAFTVSAKGISPLTILNETITLADGKPMDLKWTPPTQSTNSVITVYVDISHHGGTRGKIECEGPDTGEMEIAATLVDKLKALGVSGFPRIDIARKAKGTNSDAKVDLIMESGVSKDLVIPGLISCNGDDECPDGQKCQLDLQCK